MSIFGKDKNTNEPASGENQGGKAIAWSYQHGLNTLTIYGDGSVLVEYPHHKFKRFGSVSEYYAMTID